MKIAARDPLQAEHVALSLAFEADNLWRTFDLGFHWTRIVP
ncbi:hypothetical protein DF3PA_460004 [Candidatus Defluviicoccus seviourii]|uniref:Uncharacterized protein n=1 Tax=Candidatus Defluviicoccus seviourii TaxID=2565273 RepID=A0A564WIF9_9PROT|nr:hypothetical protein DF3PA_460004 [Candidatus Defluviicoccus seviourii]